MDTREFIDSQIGNNKEATELKELKISIIEASLDVTHSLDDTLYYAKKLMKNVEQLELYYNVNSTTNTPNHYKGKKDVISFLEEYFYINGFIDCMLFNIVKYTTRLGRKDDERKEVEKIKTYTERLLNFIEYGNSNGRE
ncbi:hypothetical protein [Staphylococcus phage vB_SauM-V1SA22]|nr:hypothetical protein [Staphylococcus phage vB_SauM-V1SA22]